MSIVTPPGAPRAAETSPNRPADGRPARSRRLKLLPLVLMLVGMLVLLYPVLATQYNNINQREFAAKYNQQVQAASPDTLADELQRARDYNGTLSGVPILDPYLTGVTTSPVSGAFEQYLDTLASFDAMSRVRVPAGNISLPVYHGTSDEVIAKGAGHLYGTSLPVGGASTHAVLTSHTGMSNATLFDNLTDVQVGDLMYVDTYGETLAYEVENIQIVLPTEIDALHAVEGSDLLTLFTCTPYAVNTHRLLVTGHRVPYDAAAAPAEPSPVESLFDLEPWMIGLLAGALVALLLIILIAIRERKRGQPAPSRAARDRSPAGGTS